MASAAEATVADALKLASAGRLPEAIKMLAGGGSAILNNASGRNILGTLYLRNGQTQEALRAFDAALQFAPNLADAHCNRGVALQKLGWLPDALSAYNAALRLAPDHPAAPFNRGNILKLLARPDEAIEAFSDVLRVNPRHAGARINRGRVLLERRAFAEALVDFDAAVANNGGGEALVGRAAALVGLMRFQEALAAIDAAQVADPTGRQGGVVRAQILLELDRGAEALAITERLAAGGMSGVVLTTVRSAALWNLGRIEDAIAVAEEGVRSDRADPRSHQNLAHFYLATGDFARGLAEYEYRGDSYDTGEQRPERRPGWSGAEPKGRRILVYAEQGIGDTIQFARYLAPLAAKGAEVQALVQPALLRLLRSVPSPVRFVGEARELEPFDVEVALLSLPRAFGTRLETIPGDTPYLAADAERIATWREQLGGGGFKVGIVWQGNPKFRNDHRRSAPLAAFAPLAAVPGVRLISLQAVHGLDQLAKLPAGMTVETLGAKITDNPEGLDEIAAVIAHLDLVVTSDTAVAHLAGALGRPVWVALAYDPDWRWMRERADSPWYPTMRLFRQKKIGDWAGVFAEIAAALRERAAAKP